jgi:hypothetical protein
MGPMVLHVGLQVVDAKTGKDDENAWQKCQRVVLCHIDIKMAYRTGPPRLKHPQSWHGPGQS